MGSKIRTETEITGWLPGPTPDNGFWGLTIERLQEGSHQEEHHICSFCDAPPGGRRAATRRSITEGTNVQETDRLGFEIHLPSTRPERVT